MLAFALSKKKYDAGVRAASKLLPGAGATTKSSATLVITLSQKHLLLYIMTFCLYLIFTF
jgi:hypothetical protein